MRQLPYPPRVTDFTHPFWQGLREGELRTTRCRSCSHVMFPPRFVCSNCWGDDLEWIRLQGTGVLRSYTEVWAAPRLFVVDVPYVLGLMDLDEGVRCAARVQEPYDELAPDCRVSFVPVPAEPEYLFAFVREDAGAGRCRDAGPTRQWQERAARPETGRRSRTSQGGV